MPSSRPDERDHAPPRKRASRSGPSSHPNRTTGTVRRFRRTRRERGSVYRRRRPDRLASTRASRAETARERTHRGDRERRGGHAVLARLGYLPAALLGHPIPVIHCDNCGPVTVPEEDLPVELPEFINTTGNPLDAAEGGNRRPVPTVAETPPARRTRWTPSSTPRGYFLRYVSPGLEDAPFDLEQANDWMPVDQYVGGIEHAVMHLLYSRFFSRRCSPTTRG